MLIYDLSFVSFNTQSGGESLFQSEYLISKHEKFFNENWLSKLSNFRLRLSKALEDYRNVRQLWSRKFHRFPDF